MTRIIANSMPLLIWSLNSIRSTHGSLSLQPSAASGQIEILYRRNCSIASVVGVARRGGGDVADVHAEEPFAGMGTICRHGNHLQAWEPFAGMGTICRHGNHLQAWELFACIGAICMHRSHLHGHYRTSQYACVRLSPLGAWHWKQHQTSCMHASSSSSLA